MHFRFANTKTILVIAGISIALGACAQTASLSHLPSEQRAEAGKRLQRCDELARGLRPNRERGGGFSILGSGIDFRDSVENQSYARDQYFAALNGLLQSCRSWQSFEITTEQFRIDRMAFASVYTQSVDSADDAAARTSLLEALARVEDNAQGAALNEAVGRLEEAARRLEPTVDLSTALADIADRLRDLQSRPSGETPAGLGGGVVEFSGTAGNRVVFYFNSNDTNFEEARLDSLVSLQVPQSERLNATVLGYADTNGGDVVNAALSLTRARNVAAALTRRGVQVRYVAGGGETGEFGDRLEDNRLAIVIFEPR